MRLLVQLLQHLLLQELEAIGDFAKEAVHHRLYVLGDLGVLLITHKLFKVGNVVLVVRESLVELLLQF